MYRKLYNLCKCPKHSTLNQYHLFLSTNIKTNGSHHILFRYQTNFLGISYKIKVTVKVKLKCALKCSKMINNIHLILITLF